MFGTSVKKHFENQVKDFERGQYFLHFYSKNPFLVKKGFSYRRFCLWNLQCTVKVTRFKRYLFTSKYNHSFLFVKNTHVHKYSGLLDFRYHPE